MSLALLHGEGCGGDVAAGCIGGVDFDEFFEDAVRERLHGGV